MTLKLTTAVACGTTLVTAFLIAMTFAGTASAGSCAHAKAAPKRVSDTDAQRAVFCLLNKERTERGLHRLHQNNELRRAARNHSAYMRRHACFSHECSGEASIDGRLRAVHYLRSGLSRWLYGENIAYGKRRWASPKAMVKAWMHSAGHRENILNPDFRDLGVGVIWGTFSNRKGRGGMYTTDFGLRRG